MSDVQPVPAARSAFIPVLLLVIAVLGWAAFQTYQLVSERNNLTSALAAQEPQIESSRKVRAAFDSIATRTARIAQAGNANATVVVEELRKRGLTINPAGETPVPPAAP